MVAWQPTINQLNMAHKPYVIGLTGNIATGKSTVLHYLAGKGAHIIDADQLTHRAMAPDGLAYAAIVAAFGPGVVGPDGAIDRPALGRIVFGDAAALRQLEQIVHPAVFELAVTALAAVDAPVVIIEAIKLLEARNLVTLCDEIWVVTSTAATQLRRLRDQRGMDEATAQQRMAAQSSQAGKERQADRIITNDSTLAALFAQLDAIWQQLGKELSREIITTSG